MEHVKRGKLKLKGSAALKVAAHDSSSSRKKHKKVKKHKKHKAHGSDDEGEGDFSDARAGGDAEASDMTPAQRRHEEHRKKRVRVLLFWVGSVD